MAEPMDIGAWRSTMRRELLAARSALAPEFHREASARIFAQVDKALRERKARTVGVYLPIRKEPDPLPWIESFVAGGGIVALPVVTGRNQPLVFRCWAPGQLLETGVFGTACPSGDAMLMPDALVIPLLGFDLDGYRLGYGGGYYDRTLASASPRPYAIGVGFEMGRVPTIYPQAYDLPMDCIITEALRNER